MKYFIALFTLACTLFVNAQDFPTNEFERPFTSMSTYNEAERVYRDPIRYESNFVFNFNDSKNVVYEDSTGHHVFRWTRSYWETPEGAEQYYVIESRDLKGNATAFSIYEHYIVVRYFSPFGMLKVKYTNAQ